MCPKKFWKLHEVLNVRVIAGHRHAQAREMTAGRGAQITNSLRTQTKVWELAALERKLLKLNEMYVHFIHNFGGKLQKQS